MSSGHSSITPNTGASASTSAATATSPRSFKGFHVPRVLTWTDPYETGLLLAETLGLFVLFGSTLTLRYFLKAGSFIVGLLSLLEWGSRSISGQRTGLVSSYQPSRFLPLNDKVVNDIASYVSYAFRRLTYGIQHFLDARSPTQGLKVSGSLYVAYLLLGILRLRTLVLSTIIIAFSLPPLYLQFKPEVDNAVNDLQEHLHGHVKKATALAHEKAGPQIEYAKKFLGPRGGFDKSNDVRPVGEIPTAGAVPTEHTTSHSSTHTPGSSQSTYPSTTESTSLKGGSSNSTHVPDEVFKNFDSVPTLTGNVPIDHAKLNASLAADKAKAEGAVNGL